MIDQTIRNHRGSSRACGFVAVALAWFALALPAHAVLSINEPWVRAAHDGHTAELFVKLRSSDEATLAGVDSFAARRIEMRDGRRVAASIVLPANVLVELRPDGLHLRLTGLVRRLKQGEHVPVTLMVISSGGLKQTIYINAEVRHRSPSEDEMDPKGPHVHPH